MAASRLIKRRPVAKKATDDGPKQQQLHERLDEFDLVKIHEIFVRQKGKRMNAKELRQVLFVIAKVQMSDEDYDLMFMKMNSKRDGHVTWDEFISYLILSFEQQEIKTDYETLEAPIPQSATLIRSYHRYTINRIIFCPTVKPQRTYGWHDGSIMTCSRDGTINYWSLDMQFERSVKSSCPNLKVQSTWVTDMIALPDVSVVCTSSSERDLRFYDTSARKFDLRIIFTSIEHAISTMNYHFSSDVNEESKLLLGDLGGNVHVIYIQTFGRGPFRSKLGLPLLEVRYNQVIQGFIEGFRVTVFHREHSEYVRQIKFYPALNSILSCSECPKIGLIMHDLTESKGNYVYQTPKGTWCFDITERVLHMVSGGADCVIRLWNPFVPQHPTAILYGHHGGIVSLCLQDDGKRLYSLSQDKYIKVWDVSTQLCEQNYLGIPQELGEHSDMVTLYNPQSRQWIVGSNQIAVVPLNPEQSGEHTDGYTHTAGVSVVLYNTLFKVVITCGLDSHIIVWNPWDGRRMIAMKEAHTKSVHAELVPIEITAACFGPCNQRLITGAHDGSLKIWNFNTGTCIRNMRIAQDSEIKSIVWVKNRILAMGWNRCITEFGDSSEAVGTGGEFSKNWDKRHQEDISCAVVRVPQTLVTATYDGELIMWRLETGQPYKQYNVSDPTTRIKIKYKANKTKEKEEKKIDLRSQRKSILGGVLKPQTIGPEKVFQPSTVLQQGPTAAQIKAARMRRVSTVVMPEQCIPLRRLSVHCMLFLLSRPMEPDYGTLLVSLENGSVQMWSHHISGGFITSFSAIHKAGDYVISMTSDTHNEFLFTGTSIGYIKTWLIKNYCVPNPEPVSIPKYRLMFPFLWGDRFVGRAARIVKTQPKPWLLNSYKGHMMSVSGLTYIEEAKILVSSSVDYTARMWTLAGRYLQTLGSFKKWKPLSVDEHKNEDFEHTIPPDILRVASSTTFRVLNGGTTLRSISSREIQAKVEKELLTIDLSKIYGDRLKEPILGHYFTVRTKASYMQDVVFDTSFPYIPVYQHLIMPETEGLQMPKIRDTIAEEGDTVKEPAK